MIVVLVCWFIPDTDPELAVLLPVELDVVGLIALWVDDDESLDALGFDVVDPDVERVVDVDEDEDDVDEDEDEAAPTRIGYSASMILHQNGISICKK